MAEPTVFLAHIGKDKTVWGPYKEALEKLFGVDVVVGEYAIGRARGTAQDMMRQLVGAADLGVFLYTSENENVDFELREWSRSKGHGTALVLVGKGVQPPEPVRTHHLTTVYFDPQQPWAELSQILSNSREFIAQWRLRPGLATWKQEAERLRDRLENQLQGLPKLSQGFEDAVGSLEHLSRAGPAYDPVEWRFCVNWEAAPGNHQGQLLRRDYMSRAPGMPRPQLGLSPRGHATLVCAI
jgi:hypothetical protein